jgi:heptose I phosphotransferase
MEMQLPEMWLARWKVSEPFDYVFNLKGEIFREQPGRKTLKFFESQQAYFVKMHFGVGWKEIFKNIFQFRPPILGAKNLLLSLKRSIIR